MTKDWMKRATKVDYTAYDIKCGCWTPKHERQLTRIFKRKARRNENQALKKLI